VLQICDLSALKQFIRVIKLNLRFVYDIRVIKLNLRFVNDINSKKVSAEIRKGYQFIKSTSKYFCKNPTHNIYRSTKPLQENTIQHQGNKYHPLMWPHLSGSK
jgi:hypothetical protein